MGTVPLAVTFIEDVSDRDCERFWNRSDEIFEKHTAEVIGSAHMNIGIENQFEVPSDNEDAFRRDLDIWLSNEKTKSNSILVNYRIYEDYDELWAHEKQLGG
jgi:hypothetical protein